MKILEMFGEPISTGGQESFVFQTIQAIDTRGLKFDVLTPYYCDNEKYRNIIEQMGGSIACFELPFCPGKSRNSLIRPMLNYLENNRYDVIHIHSGSISVLALASAAARLRGIPKIIVHSHCTGDRKTMKYRLVKAAMTPLLKFCPTDYCACSTEAGQWKFTSQVVKEKLIILKNGVDLRRFSNSDTIRSAMRKQLHINDQTFVVGHVGRFDYPKNHEYLIKIFSKVKKQRANSKLLLIGEGEKMDAMRTQVKKLQIEKDTYFTGNVNNVEDYMQAMDVLVLPSRYEGFGIVGVEAQAIGLPVLASTNVPSELGITDLVCYLSLDNPEQWVTKLCELPIGKREGTTDQIRAVGYDVQLTAEALRNLYLDGM